MRSLREHEHWIAVVALAGLGSFGLWQHVPTYLVIMCFAGAAFAAGMLFGIRLTRSATSEATGLAKEQAVEIVALRRRRGFHVER